jgi:hypothetical protein
MMDGGQRPCHLRVVGNPAGVHAASRRHGQAGEGIGNAQFPDGVGHGFD